MSSEHPRRPSLRGTLRSLCGRAVSLPIALRGSLACAHFGLIWWLSDHPGKRAWRSALWTVLYNGGHAVLFGVFALLLGLLVSRSIAVRGDRRAALLVTGWVAFFGVVDECHQSLIPGRNASILDLGTDVSGAFFTIFLLRGLVFGARTDWRLCAAGFVGSFVFPLVESRHVF